MKFCATLHCCSWPSPFTSTDTLVDQNTFYLHILCIYQFRLNIKRTFGTLHCMSYLSFKNIYDMPRVYLLPKWGPLGTFNDTLQNVVGKIRIQHAILSICCAYVKLYCFHNARHVWITNMSKLKIKLCPLELNNVLHSTQTGKAVPPWTTPANRLLTWYI